jgi:hypothetical protein
MDTYVGIHFGLGFRVWGLGMYVETLVLAKATCDT